MKISENPAISDSKDIKRLFQHALKCHKTGDLEEAERCYREILKNDPDHPDAIHMQVMISFQTGNLAEAQNLINKALAMEVPESTYQSNLAIVLHALNRTGEAVQCYRRAVKLNPFFFEGYFNLGTLLQSIGETEEAIQCYQSALELNEEFAPAQNNLGMLLIECGSIKEGLACLQRAVKLDTDFAVAFNNLSHAFYVNGNLKEAVSHCRRALQIVPDFPEALNNLGIFLSAIGEPEAAEIQFKNALRARENFSEAYANIGKLQLSRNRIQEAFENLRMAAYSERDNHLYWQYLSDAMNLIPVMSIDSRLVSDLEQCLALESIDTRGAGKAAANILLNSTEVGPWLSTAMEQQYKAIFNAIHSGALSNLLGHSLLLRLMKNSIVYSFGIEMLLTLIRKCFLQLAVEDPLYLRKSPQNSSFLYALARQCFLNEYIYFQTPEESDWLAELENRVNHLDILSNEDHWPIITLLSSYIALYRFEWAHGLVEVAQSIKDEQFRMLIHYQIKEPL